MSDIEDEWEKVSECFSDKSESPISQLSKSLKNKIFCGCYKERKLLESTPIPMYKDVIEINESELEFMKLLQSTKQFLRKHFDERLKLCISGPTSSPSLWTNLSGVTFGNHFFILKGLFIQQNVVHFKVKWLRSIKEEQLSSSSSSFKPIDWDSFLIDTDSLKKKLRDLSEIITIENCRSVTRILLLVLLSLIALLYEILLLSLKVIQELNYFFRTLQPVMIACVEGLTKAWGGLLILITMIWRTRGNPGYPNHDKVPRYQPPTARNVRPYLTSK